MVGDAAITDEQGELAIKREALSPVVEATFALVLSCYVEPVATFD